MARSRRKTRGPAAQAPAPPPAAEPKSAPAAEPPAPAAAAPAPPAALPDCIAKPWIWDWRRDGLLSAVLFGIAFAVFANTLGHGFVYDDRVVIMDNARLASPWNFAGIFGTPYMLMEGNNLWRPLTLWSFAVDQALFGEGPARVRWINVLMNAALAVQLFALVLLLLRERTIAFLSALFFAVHPVHTEVVANGVGRSELAAMMLMAAGVAFHFLHLRAVLRRRRPGGAEPTWHGVPLPTERVAWGWLLAAMACYFLSLLFKETGVVLPGLLFLVEWMLVRRGGFWAVMRKSGRYFIYAVPLAAVFAMRTAVIGATTPAVQEVMAQAPRGSITLYGIETMLRYIGQLLWPVPGAMVADYSDYLNPIATRPWEPMVLAAVLVLGGIAAACIAAARRGIWIPAFAASWYFLVMLPTSNILVPIGTVRADRLQFAPSFGFALVSAWAVWLLMRRSRGAGIALAAVLVVGYSASSIERNRVWESSRTLWTVTVEQNPGNAVAWSFNADFARDDAFELQAAGRTAEAEELFAEAERKYRRAMELRESLGSHYREAANSLAAMFRALGRTQEAIELYKLNIRRIPTNPVAFINLGEIQLVEQRRADLALENFQAATRIDPENFAAWVNKSQALNILNRFDEARAAIARARALDPAHPQLPAAEQAIATREAAVRGG